MKSGRESATTSQCWTSFTSEAQRAADLEKWVGIDLTVEERTGIIGLATELFPGDGGSTASISEIPTLDY
jgi:hypothetical protein